jgi:Tfp pilus assembly protein FimT
MKTAYAIAAIFSILTAYGLMGTSDFNEQLRIENSKKEIIAAAKAERAEMIKQGKLIDDSNYFVFPIAQMSEPK